MSLRLVISDVDGTLVDKQKRVTEGTIAAVGRLRDAGIPFTLISARPQSGLLPLAKQLGLTVPIAAFNGGTLISADGTVTERHVVPEDVVRELFALCDGSGADPWIFADGRWYARNMNGTHLDSERRASMQEPVAIDDMSPLFARADKVTWVSDDHAMLSPLNDRAQAAFGARATVGMSQTYYLDVTHLSANKGDGIATLARSLGVGLDEVAVIGDMPNDLPMFARAGLAIAMGQAPDAVKAKAAHVTTSNEEDGVAHAIDTILLPMVGDTNA
ncbi:Cof-type HAD-IIB family hydrolase [Sphingomonas nostoxanthinifaciens]|uniref:Cof-type HAD-IIB family hydrolase n=1 Tax=Sphingomonas nostoxanthinifaciens TaxID=2872652 RepID=UPI001CC21AD0|nr:Cof-type HAD-IIB family hydrolase [Sphingomonas nostoxanthinifaciens]UAK23509.1 Cof-type HAD-IIB family hydrolase [Sphingomonas nostoxanthinifaciens]